MRTTVTLDDDVEAAVRRLMAQRGLSFKRALNEAIRAGLARGTREQSTAQATYTRPKNLGVPSVDLTHALRLAGEIEDEDVSRRIVAGR